MPQLQASTLVHYQMVRTISWPELGYVFNMLCYARVEVLSVRSNHFNKLDVMCTRNEWLSPSNGDIAASFVEAPSLIN
jgi:hypothetical protein